MNREQIHEQIRQRLDEVLETLAIRFGSEAKIAALATTMIYNTGIAAYRTGIAVGKGGMSDDDAGEHMDNCCEHMVNTLIDALPIAEDLKFELGKFTQSIVTDFVDGLMLADEAPK